MESLFERVGDKGYESMWFRRAGVDSILVLQSRRLVP
jgi:hypothetical protein